MAGYSWPSSNCVLGLPTPIEYRWFTDDKRRWEPPMAFDESLAARIRQHLARCKSVEEKKMFGGVGFRLNGNMLVGVWKDSLIARLGPDEGEEALNEPHVRSSTSPAGRCRPMSRDPSAHSVARPVQAEPVPLP